MATVGIIGFGSFGKFLAETLSPHATVYVYSRSGAGGKWAGSFEQAATADYVILAVPLESYEAVVMDLAPIIRRDGVVIDVCSVKVRPISILKRMLSGQPIVATHPMFGPESASSGVAGHTIVMCKDGSDASAFTAVKKFSQSLGLHTVEMSLEEHDRSIAVVQGLTFFVARSLDKMGVSNELLRTPSFERLLHLAELERHHSQELFETIQLGNKYAADVRTSFLTAAGNIHTELLEK